MQVCFCSSVRGVRSRVVRLISAVARGCEFSMWCRLSSYGAPRQKVGKEGTRLESSG